MSFELNTLFGSFTTAIEQLFSPKVEKSTESPVPKVTLQDVCTKMHDQGFQYASFYDSTIPLEAKFRKPTNVSVKPDGGMYFSALRKGYGPDSDSEEHECDSEAWVPDWYLYTKFDFESRFKVNAKYDLVFAKMDLGNVLDSNKKQNLEDYEVVDVMCQEMTQYDWREISKSFDGVSGTGVPSHNKYLCWDVDTVVLWNRNAVEGDLVVFKNAGHYEYSGQGLDSRGAPGILLE